MVKIIGISGRKQAGKNTVANFINGRILKEHEMIDNFTINSSGQLEIKTSDQIGHKGWGVFDITRKDMEFLNYAEKELWPYVKLYHFADSLKELSINLFNINSTKVYGTDEQKNTITEIKWENMPEYNGGKTGNMTIREFLQHFGTNVMRKIKNDIWVSDTIKRILFEDSQVAIIPDVRFPNEVDAIKENGGIVLRLTRDIYRDGHKCEASLDKENFDWSKFDHIIDNNDCNIESLCKSLNEIKHIWST
tara:strand:+ start:1796 stop:2542 length:747 start_codon:yes stop_codon:yes gene_type:complete